MNATPFYPYQTLAAELLTSFHLDADGAHDISHLERVWRNAREIYEVEGGDLEAVAAAVLLHDCVQIPKDSPLRLEAAGLAAARARTVLAVLHWPTPRIDLVAEAIETHSYSRGLTPTSLEGRVLQDADRLDAIGFTGIARCFYTAGRMGSLLYDSRDPMATDRPLDDLRFALDHFPKKLLRLTEGFQTDAGKKLAQHREQVLRGFYEGMTAEIGR
jgi:uncharacterized protein